MGWESDSSEEDVPVPVAGAKKTTWEDDDSSEDEEGPVIPSSQPKNETKKPVSKAKSKKDLLRKLQDSNTEAGPVDPLAAKLELQKLVEEGDLALTQDLFGETEGGSASNPKTKTEFEAFATILGKKLQTHEDSMHYATCLKALVRVALENSGSDVCKALGTLCNTQASEKAKQEKEAANKGKKKKTKVALQKDHGDFMDAGLAHREEEYDDAGFDDGDFM
eukprot:TRINITY_DN4240_c0_g1_i1.p1 TRINITY_DN4240_c0_g1~~TRINITY_DN4240_c0_g1_i1.p1  ORF type:complete len:221 (-),score=72.90 TRINITY_DN4240_c0_g1_i1:143-805(-)